MNLSIRFTEIFQRTGKLIETYHVGPDFKPSVVKSPEYGLVISWPNEYQFLSVAIPGFIGGLAGLERVFSKYGMDFASKVPEDIRKKRNFISGFLTVGVPPTPEFTLDTDDEDFCEWASRWIKGQLEESRAKAQGVAIPNDRLRTFMELEIYTYALDSRDSEEGRIRVVLEPIRLPRYFDGYVAVDFGTTATTAVLLPGGTPSLDRMELIDADGQRGARKSDTRPTETKLNVEAVDGELSDHPGSVEWSVGSIANKAPTDGLVIGAKRLAAGPMWEDKLVVFAYDKLKPERSPRSTRREIPLLNRHPAELFLCRLFQRFCEATNTRPRNLAVTYPTTFSSRELRQLKQVVARGWLRMHVREHTSNNISIVVDKSQTQRGDRLGGRIGLALDEATAAAFFFIHRKISVPGGMLRFRYLYPNGLNLLLYDCGGGTTDIALVSARLQNHLGDGAVNELRISVRARSGLRGFGGDNITWQIARLIKAKLAIAIWNNAVVTARLGIVEPRPNFPPPDARAADVEAFLKKFADSFDKLVPTRFNPHRMDPITLRNREHVLKLWEWSEKVKQKLNAPSVPVPVVAPRDKLVEYLAGATGVPGENMLETINGIKLNRNEVDRMVQQPVLQSIRNCNNLIRERLTDQGEDVHWVVAAGNASLYPLIQEALKQNLNVMFLESDELREARFGMDTNNLKYAVAKGAALALATLEYDRILTVSFDKDLSEHLPFELAYKDPVKGAYRILFREGERYDKLTSQTVSFHPTKEPVATGTEPGNAQAGQKWFILYRRWPGQTKDEYDVYARYYFEDEVHSPITITYEAEKGDFVVTDSRGAVGSIALPETSDGLYVSPVQRGDL